MKKSGKVSLALLCVVAMFTGCGQDAGGTKEMSDSIVLSDEGITVNGEAVGNDKEAAVYVAHDIVYYEEGKDFTYGEGTEADAHSSDEAAAHTVVHITEPGTYEISGKLSAGQIAVDLGDEAEVDPNAVVTLVLNGVDITCTVAPAVIFYDVYECGSDDAESAAKDVDTAAAGANVVIADGSTNYVNGSYVAKIYKSVELNEAGTEVVDSKKKHKYDGAFYSKMTMNINGQEAGTGVLNIIAENEGLDTELHLTINGGNINIVSGNDGINTNEDYVSVTTVNGGSLNITVDGSTKEGDGIDSNGWLVINGGSVTTSACDVSMDAGIDSDMGIHINGGVVVAGGNMLDHISESQQNYVVFSFAEKQSGGSTYELKNEENKVVASATLTNGFTQLVISAPEMKEGNYTLWCGDTKMEAVAGESGMFGGMGGFMPGGMDGMEPPKGEFKPGEMPQMPEGMEFPEGGFNPGEAPQMPAGTEMPQGGFKPGGMNGMELPEGMEFPADMKERPQGGKGEREEMTGEMSTTFAITAGGSYFMNVKIVQ